MKEIKTGKRDLILHAAVEVFTARGYENARMEGIAASAGVGKGTIYEYFDSKLHLFSEMMKNSWDTYSQSFDRQVIEDMSFAEYIHASVVGHVRFARRNRELTRVIFWDTRGLDPDLKDWVLKMRQEKEKELLRIVQKAVTAGEIRSVDPHYVYLVISGIMGSIFSETILNEKDHELAPELIADEMVHFIMNGLKR